MVLDFFDYIIPTLYLPSFTPFYFFTGQISFFTSSLSICGGCLKEIIMLPISYVSLYCCTFPPPVKYCLGFLQYFDLDKQCYYSQGALTLGVTATPGPRTTPPPCTSLSSISISQRITSRHHTNLNQPFSRKENQPKNELFLLATHSAEIWIQPKPQREGHPSYHIVSCEQLLPIQKIPI